MSSSRLMKYFEQYVKNYDMNNINVKVKYFHCLKMMELCRDIATSLNVFNDEEIVICELIGLFHDIGAFDSVNNYHIIEENDDYSMKSINILFDKGLLRKITNDTKYDSLIKMLIYCHNKTGIPEQFDDKLQAFCKVIQDAHKIDMFRIVINYPYLDTKIDKYPSALIYNQFKNYKQINSKILDNNADNILIVISNLFGLWYKYSFEYINNNSYTKKIFNSLYYTENEYESFFKQLDKVIDIYIKNKLNNK